MQQPEGSYADVNGMAMYYEIHGADTPRTPRTPGTPLVLLHGAFGTVEGWGAVLPTLAETRPVIAVELQGHGHTADRDDRPLSFGQMADDTAALLGQLSIPRADIFGYSMGGGVALALVVRRPDLVRRMAILGAGTGATRDTYEPETYRQFKSMTPENFHFPQVKDPYTRVAPDPSKWPTLVAKILQMDDDFHGFPEVEVRAIQARTLVMVGDRDGVRVEHAVEMYRRIPGAQLAVLPGGDHFALFTHPGKVLANLLPFLDTPMPEMAP